MYSQSEENKREQRFLLYVCLTLTSLCPEEKEEEEEEEEIEEEEEEDEEKEEEEDEEEEEEEDWISGNGGSSKIEWNFTYVGKLSTIVYNVQAYHQHHLCSVQGQVLHCKLRHQGCNSAQRQVFSCKLRNLGCSFTRDEQVRQLPVAFHTPLSHYHLNTP